MGLNFGRIYDPLFREVYVWELDQNNYNVRLFLMLKKYDLDGDFCQIVRKKVETVELQEYINTLTNYVLRKIL